MARLEPRNTVINIKVSAREWEAIQKHAAESGMTGSDFIRSSALTIMALRGDRHAVRMLLQGLGNLVGAAFPAARRLRSVGRTGG